MLMDNTNAWFKFLFSIPRPTSTSDLWVILVPCLFYSATSAQGCCISYSHVWEYQLTLINAFFKLHILVFCEQILGCNNYNEWIAEKSHSHKNMQKLCLNAIKTAPTYLHLFQTGIFIFDAVHLELK